MSKEPSEFGSRLRQMREAAGLTQEELADRAGVTAQAVSALERGHRRKPYQHTIRALAAALGDSELNFALLQVAARPQATSVGVGPDVARLPLASDLPRGIATFLLSDVQGSTRLWDVTPEKMRAALLRHDELIEHLVAHHAGSMVRPRGEGDSRFAVFARASDALAAACAIQQAFAIESWPTPEPLRVRMALHSGEAELREGDYYGGVVNRCARLRGAAHGGQILISEVLAGLVADALPDHVSLRDLGQHTLKDLVRPERIFQVVVDDLDDEFPPLVSHDRAHQGPGNTSQRARDPMRHNLPIQLNSLIGREQALADVRKCMASSRLVTLTGTGGCGKTRLAFSTAAACVHEYPDGVWLTELAGLVDPALVPVSVAAALGIAERSGQPVLAAIVQAVRTKRLLLVLDNCEHLIEASARLVEFLLQSCPELRVVATSREPLGIHGEVRWRVPSLTIPTDDQSPTADRLLQYESVQLFMERATAVLPTFSITSFNARGIAQICRHLDGIPLAIELAAARVSGLAADQIAARLDQCFFLLTDGSRTALSRQQTLAAAVAWSYELLSTPERILFERLAVFAGGFTLEAAETVCGGGEVQRAAVADLLVRLLDKSLVQAESGPGAFRYRLLETLRQYARERLIARGEEDILLSKHLGWSASLVNRPNPLGGQRNEADWLNCLDPEHDNLRAALEWASTDSSRVDTGIGLCVGLYRFWLVRGYLTEGRHWLDEFLALNPVKPRPGETMVKALFAAAMLALFQGEYEHASTLVEQCLVLGRDLGDEADVADALGLMPVLAVNQGNYARATELSDEGIAVSRALGAPAHLYPNLMTAAMLARLRGDRGRAIEMGEEALTLSRRSGDVWVMGHVLSNLGLLYLEQGRPDHASGFFAEALTARRELGDRAGITGSLKDLARVALMKGELVTAQTLYEESLVSARDLGDRSSSADALLGLGRVARARGDREEAGRLYRESLDLYREGGHALGVQESLLELHSIGETPN